MRFMPAQSSLAAALWLFSQFANSAACDNWPPEVYLLRHAEKQDNSRDSPLSKRGLQRADALPAALSGIAVGAILVSDRIRTQQTALALSEAIGIDTQIFNQHSEAGLTVLLGTICLAGGRGTEAVVVVGHDSTVPKIMSAIGVAPGEEERPAFGDLFVVKPNDDPVTVEHRRF
jgi:phosphohistidine phosphatase SixA